MAEGVEGKPFTVAALECVGEILNDAIDLFASLTSRSGRIVGSRDGKRMHATKAELERYSRAGRGWLVSTDVEGGVPGREKTSHSKNILAIRVSTLFVS